MAGLVKMKCKWMRYIIIIYVIGFGALIGCRVLKAPQIELPKSTVSLILPTDVDLDGLMNALKDKGIKLDESRFRTTASLLSFSTAKNGHYKLEQGIGYQAMINKLKLGQQDPVNLVISGNIQTKEKLCGILAKQLEPDSTVWLQKLNDKQGLQALGFTPENSILLFIPNTYNVYWNRAPQRLLEDMKKQYDRFWTTTRKDQAKALHLSTEEVMIMASIVISESQRKDELAIIAGVYINRIRLKMPLQADPTVKFAVGDFGLRRILHKHLEIDSPYNTYRNLGLPPGPICIPSIAAIDAVLNYKQHDYVYFCAKEDLSGAHAFAKTLQQHNVNAQAYRNALNKRKIFE